MWTRHADHHLHGGRPERPGPRPLPPPRPPRPAQDGGPLAQEPRPDSRPDRRLRRRLPAHVQRDLDQYHEGGLPHLRRCRWHHPYIALAKYQDSLEEYFLKHPVRSAKQARAIIEQQTGVRRGLSQVRHFLKDQLGLRWRKTGAIPVPPKETVQEHAQKQAVFLQEQLEPRLEEARRGRRQVYFVDAAHFVFAPFLGFLWCAARLFVRAASGRKRYNVLGALDAVTHRLIRVTNYDYINAESVCALLRAVAGRLRGVRSAFRFSSSRTGKPDLRPTPLMTFMISRVFSRLGEPDDQCGLSAGILEPEPGRS